MATTITLDPLDQELGTARRPYGVVFARPEPLESAPNRADIACFVGFIARRDERPVTTPEAIDRWGDFEPIDSWDDFDRLFDWAARPVADSDRTVGTYMGAAVRSFFAQGGRKCYVVRVGDPWPVEPIALDGTVAESDRQARIEERIDALIPGFPGGFSASSADDRSTWRGMAHLFGLPDVSFLSFPDLADIVAAAPVPVELPDLPPEEIPERFQVCAESALPAPVDTVGSRLPAPGCDEDGYVQWSAAIQRGAEVVQRFLPEVQLAAAVPIPAGADTPLIGDLLKSNLGAGIASAFVQLAYPWLRTPGSTNLPGGIESPDGVLLGVLARNALTRGTFRSAANAGLGDVVAVEPLPRRVDLLRRDEPGSSLLERVSLFGSTPGGLRLLSDVTTSLDPTYRPAGIGRLTASLLRAARRLGEETTFEPNGERLWAHLRDRLNGLLARLFAAGALRGVTAAAAFSVRCDRTTMTSRDLDEGRVIASIQFDPAAPVGRITVVLTLNEGGGVVLTPARGAA